MAERITRIIEDADEKALALLAGRLAHLARPGDVILLEGGLGAGKTAFARAFIRALTDPAEEVPSPTFTLAQSYDCESGTIWHYDLYRLEGEDELPELDLEEAFAQAICLVEWPDRLGRRLPAERLTLSIGAAARPQSRRLVLAATPGWAARLESLDDV